jgi:hypothetical protein
MKFTIVFIVLIVCFRSIYSEFEIWYYLISIIEIGVIIIYENWLTPSPRAVYNFIIKSVL